jgi:hypothetical protein
MKRLVLALWSSLILAALSGAGTVHADSTDNELIVVCTCWNEAGLQVVCQGGFSLFKDNVPRDARIEVLDYSGKVLTSAAVDSNQGRARFQRPEGEFYVLFSGPPGYTAEVDWRDIDATPPGRP